MANGLFYSLYWVVIVLGIMIVVHEFGHFAAAKFFGVKVEVFSVGFGKRLFGFRKGDTDYRISLLPLGGYVKMAGENPMESRTGDPGEFMSHPRWQRFIIAVAGPAMNIILAIALLTGVFMIRYERPVYLDQPAVIGWVLENSPAEKAGFLPGDRIVRIADLQNPTWEQVIPKIMLNPNQALNLAIQRGTQILDKTIVPQPSGVEQFGYFGWLPDQPNTVTEIEPNMPAAKAGIRAGDEIIAINGIAVRSTPGMARQLQETKDQPVTVTVLRDGHEWKTQLTPALTDVDGHKQFRIGVRSDPQHVDKLPFGQAVSKSLEQNKRNSMLILELVQKMAARKVSVKQMEGPIGIARASGQAAREPGWTPLLGLMAAISLNLGIFNLFPIPILDGGLILLLLIEAVMRRDISQRLKERIYQAAFVCLILFAGLVLFNDVMKALPGLAQHIQ